MAFFGVGSQTSPISLDDSEDEVYCELYKDSNHSSSSSLSVTLEKPPLPPWGCWPTEGQPPQWDRKRKRTQSLTSHNAGPSVPQNTYNNTLENRLSQPESKKAKKRRRKAERQALEDARLQNINWLNGPSPFASGVPILPPRSWSSDVQMYGNYLPPQPTDHASLLKSGMITGLTPLSSFAVLPDPDDFTPYDHCEPPSVTPPSPSSQWVSSMAKAAENDPIDLTTEEQDDPSQWSPLSIQIPMSLPLPSSLPPLLPSHPTNTPHNPSRSNVSTLSKSVEHHALPPKPPPQQQPVVQGTIGMKPDQDPNSKHGIFQLSSATKEAGTDGKKGPHYMPNPARTLVMEHLPKSHRHPDYINNWSKSACGARPVHMFIDGPGGKALIEFATAELARKAWASPKLGPIYGHPIRGKPREDMIKVWWYRVDGVGASSGVGEIEEGEIEGDTIEREVDQPTRKETKKEKKARLAKEREEKRMKRELELRLIKERNALQQQQAEVPTSSIAVPERTPPPLTPRWSPSLSPRWSPRSPCWTPTPPATNHHPAFGPGAITWTEWEETPPATIWNQSWVVEPQPATGDAWNQYPVGSTWIVAGQEDGLDDYESDMEIDEPKPPQAYPAVQPPPLHSSLPPRPAPNIAAPLPRVAVRRPPPLPRPPPPSTNLAPPSSRPVCETPPPVAPPPPPPPIIVPSESSSSSSTTPLPSEPRAMKNAPTEPSFTKRALMARQKELEEKITKSKLELAETRAAGSASKPGTPVISAQPANNNTIPVKPLMDLGEKQAMEDRLRKLVLQSQRARGKAALPADNNSNGASNVSPATTVTPADVPSISPSTSASPSSYSSPSSSAPSPVVPSDQFPPDQLTTVSLSAHNFSLEDLAVSFITQTIETIKSQPAPTQTPAAISVHPSKKPASTTIQSNNNNSTTKLELAAKQRRLEQHITESKNLMTKLSQAQTKQEKDRILKAMREMTRSFEEGSQSNTTSTTTTTITTVKPKTGVSPPPDKKPSPTSQGTFVRIWPGSHEDVGVLILSDSDDNGESDED